MSRTKELTVNRYRVLEGRIAPRIYPLVLAEKYLLAGYLIDTAGDYWKLLDHEDYRRPPDWQICLIFRARDHQFPLHVAGFLYENHPDVRGKSIEFTNVAIPEKAGRLSLWEGEGLESALTKYEEKRGLSIVADD